MNIIDVLGPVTKGQKEVAAELQAFLLEAAKIGAEAVKDFRIDVAVLPQMCPAPAGMSRGLSSLRDHTPHVPRASGDEP